MARVLLADVGRLACAAVGVQLEAAGTRASERTNGVQAFVRATGCAIVLAALIHIATRALIVVELEARRTCALESAKHVAAIVAAMLALRALVDVNALAAGRTEAQSVGALFAGGCLLCGVVHFVVGWRLLTAIRARRIDAAVLAWIGLVTFVDIWRKAS